MRTIRCVFAGAALMAAIPLVPPAFAQTAQQTEWCADGVTPDQKINGCTAVIDSKSVHGDKLAIIFNRRAIAYYVKKEYDRAIEDYNQSILRDFSNSDTFYNRGLAYRGKGNYDHAIADYTRAITGFDAKRHPIYYKRDYYQARANVYSDKGDFVHAVADFDEAIALDPKFARGFFNRGVAKQKMGDAAGSDADLKQAKSLQADIDAE